MQKTNKPLHPLGVVGLTLLAVGTVAWAWTGEWRWVVTGLGALIVLASVGAAIDGRKQ